MSIDQFCSVMMILRKTMKCFNQFIFKGYCVYDDYRVSYFLQGLLEMFSIEYTDYEQRMVIVLNEESADSNRSI